MRPGQKQERRQQRLGFEFTGIDDLGHGENADLDLGVRVQVRSAVGENTMGCSQVNADDVFCFAQTEPPLTDNFF